MQTGELTKNSPHILADQTLTLSEFWPEVFDKVPEGDGVWWLVTSSLAQMLVASGQVVASAACSHWWYSRAERPEDDLTALGLSSFLS